MAISTIGGTVASAGGSVAPAGYKLQVGGYASTGTYTATVPAGDYIFSGAVGSTLVCNNGTSYSGQNLYPFGTNAGNFIGAGTNPINVGTPLKIMGAQSVTVNTGLLPIANLRSRATGWAQSWNSSKIVWIGTKYAAADSTTGALTSTDGAVWTSNASTFTVANCFMLANGIIFAGVNVNNTLYTSTDAITWTQRTLPTGTIADGKVQSVVYSGGKYVAFVQRGSAGTYAIHTFTSADAITWTYGAQFSGQTTANGVGIFVAASSTTIVVAGEGAGTLNQTLYYSTNGTTWTTTGTSPGSTSAWSGIEYVNGNFVVYATTSSAAYSNVWYSATGQSAFTQQTTNMGYQNSYNFCTGISWDGTNYVITVAGSNQNAVATVMYGPTFGGTFTYVNPIGNGYSTVTFNYGILSSQYVNGKWFILGYDAPIGSTSQIGYLATTFPAVMKSPNTFALYRLGETAVLN